MKYILLFLFGLFLNSGQTQNVSITLVSYNLLNFPDGRTDCGTSNINLPNRTDTLRKILRYLQPDIFVACEIQTEAGADSVLSRSLNVFGTTKYNMAPFIYSSGGGGGLNNALYYNTDKLIFLRQKPIPTGVRDINHYTLMVKDPNIAQHRDTIFVEVNMAHLKAGSTTADKADRAVQTELFRDYVDARPAMRNYIFCGDLNVYQSSEACYQTLISGGSKPFYDPIFQPGNWTSNSSFAAIHTQSPRSSGSWACGATGGLDDRFDQILVTQNILSGADRLNYQTNSYKAVGNDGQHYNSSLLSAPVNTQYPDSVVRAIYYLSDHLPVTLKMTANLPNANGLALTYSHNGPICAGNTNGTATVVPLHGSAPYTYLWDANAANQTTATATNLAPGSYCVTVTDATGLTDQVCFEIESIMAVNASIFASGSSYLCDGQATAIVSGGTGPYSFSWNDPGNQTTQTATSLCPGTYVCTISDQGTCDIDVTTIIALVGILETALENGELLVSPNPFQNVLQIRNTSERDFWMDEIILHDMHGKEFIRFEGESLQVNTTIDLDVSMLASGFYVLEMKSGQQIVRVKLVK